MSMNNTVQMTVSDWTTVKEIYLFEKEGERERERMNEYEHEHE